MADVPFDVKNLDHVVIRARTIEPMLTFYRDVLGCSVERDVASLGLFQLRAGSSLIDLVDCDGELGRKAGDPPSGDAPNMDHLCVRIDPWDPKAIQAYFLEHGVETGPVAERNGAEGVGPSIYLRDPEGNTVELKGPPTV